MFMFTGQNKLQLDYLHGLFEFAIYGGRVDNPFDNRVMVSYLLQFFDPNIIGASRGGGNKIGPLTMPSTATYRVSL